MTTTSFPSTSHTFCYLFLLVLAGLPKLALGAERTKVLFIGKDPDHAHATHMYMHTSRVLAKCVEKAGISTVVSNGWPSDASQLDQVTTIVLYATPGAEFLLDGPGAGQFHQMMRSGVGLVTIHWASSVFEANLARLGDPWGDYLGGFWVSNYGLSTTRSHLTQLVPTHPICRGWDEYEIHDEYYLRPVMRQATPLLRVTTEGEDVIVGWAYERPNGGRSYGTTLGHFYRNFQLAPFRRTVVNAILWTAHREVPEGGSDVELPEQMLRLPPEIPGNLRDDQLVAWCIVPFDAKKRTPAERAAMVSQLGMKRIAYDWRAEHVESFEEEIIAYKQHGIEYFAFWEGHEAAFQLFEKHDVHPQIWRSLPEPAGATESDRVASAAALLLPLVDRTRELKCKLGIYNHGGWGGAPDNMIAVCQHLRDHHQADHVGIVYNLHHGHQHIDDFEQSLDRMNQYLLCLNLNGMTRQGDEQGKKILPIGAGDLDLALLKTIIESDYDGPVGIIGHTQDDVALRLQDNLDGLHWLLPQLQNEPPGATPHYRTYR